MGFNVFFLGNFDGIYMVLTLLMLISTLWSSNISNMAQNWAALSGRPASDRNRKNLHRKRMDFFTVIKNIWRFPEIGVPPSHLVGGWATRPEK